MTPVCESSSWRTRATQPLRRAAWLAAWQLHLLDYGILLPAMARLPLLAGYAASAGRGWLNGRLGRDWRSMALRTRHVTRKSAEGFLTLFPSAGEATIRGLVRERYAAESREEFEGRLIAAGRVEELQWRFEPDDWAATYRARSRGLVLLTPHFDSFMLGIVFLGLSGLRVNVVTSAVTTDPRAGRAISRHFDVKYRGVERYLNGGKMVDLEPGWRPFYRMLDAGEVVVVLADAPAVGGGATAVTPNFLGARRKLAGGAFRMAKATGSDLGAFVCRYDGHASYRLTGSPVYPADSQQALEAAYLFLSSAILQSPGRWWAVDLLPDMTMSAPEGGEG